MRNGVKFMTPPAVRYGPLRHEFGSQESIAMNHQGSKAHWENVYREKSTDQVSWYQESPSTSLALIEKAGITAADNVIDVGGGASLLVDGLLAAGYQHLSVLDIAASALAIAQARLNQHASRVTWLEQDITHAALPAKYRLWHDRAVFHFLTQEDDRQAYLRALRAALLPGGFLIMAAFAPGGPSRCSGLETVPYDADKLCATLGPCFEWLETVLEMHKTPWGSTQPFNYFLLRYRG